MPETPSPDTPPVPDLQIRLQEVARLLRQGGSLDPESQRTLAELVQELSHALKSTAPPPEEVTQLVQSTAHLVESLHHQRDLGLLGQARESLERAVIRAEIQAPVAVGVARRLLDALANIGI